MKIFCYTTCNIEFEIILWHNKGRHLLTLQIIELLCIFYYFMKLTFSVRCLTEALAQNQDTVTVLMHMRPHQWL